MRVKWVLIGFGILYLIVALAFLPMDRVVSPPIEQAWELIAQVIFATITIVSVGLLEGVGLLLGPLARGNGIGSVSAPEALLTLICVAVAAFAAVQLTRKSLAPGRRGICAFFLLLALSIVAMVRLTMYSWTHFA